MVAQKKSILQMRLPMPRKKVMSTFRFQPALDKISTKSSKKHLIKQCLLWRIKERPYSDKIPCFHTDSIDDVVGISDKEEFSRINCSVGGQP
jgi:hypothetical protein